MIDIHVSSATPAFSVSAHLSRAYTHALLAAPGEPVGAILAGIAGGDETRPVAKHEDGSPATVSLVRRDPRLLNALSVADNLMMAFLAREMNQDEATQATTRVLASVGGGELANAVPDTLPLGIQRVISAERDLATDADLIVVDDLLSGVDAASWPLVTGWLRGLRERVGGVLLVHTTDPMWAMGLADRVLMVHEGKVAHHDTVRGILRHPVNQWAADHLTNVYLGKFANGVVTMADGRKIHTHVAGEPGQVLVTVHPRSVLLHRERPEGSASNVWHGRVAGLEPAGDRVRVNMLGLTPLVAEVTVASCRRLDLPVGGPIWASFKASRTDIHYL